MESTNTLGRYQIIREIARSNDIVYEAMDPAINRRVALKELCLPQNLTGAQKRERVERFYREAKAVGGLSHPNIVTIYEVGQQDDRHFIAMEFLEGQDLQDVLQVRGALPIQEAVDIILQICDALAYAHSKGVVHRDIKPDNIQILPGNIVKITDFGIARLTYEPSITTNGQVFGTPSYMSPEQVAGKPVDHRSDIFSLGVVMYEMFAGRKPFSGDTVVTITYNIMNYAPTPPPGLPLYLSQIVQRAMSKDPDQRYSSAIEIVDDLKREKASGAAIAATGSFNTRVPDPFGGAGLPPPGGYNTGGTGYPPPAPAPAPPDPFGGAKPGDIPPPPVPRRPLLSPEARYFLGQATVAFSLAGLLLFFIWALNAGYQGYRSGIVEEQASRRMELGNKAYEQQDYDTAINNFLQALTLSPDSKVGRAAKSNLAACYISKGNAEYNAGRFSSAVSMYAKAVEYDNDSPGAHYALGNALHQQGRVDDALAQWMESVKVGPGTPEAKRAGEAAGVVYYNRGVEHYRNGQLKEALDSWAKVTEVAPGSDISNLAQNRINQAVTS